MFNNTPILKRVGELSPIEEERFFEDSKQIIEFIYNKPDTLTRPAYTQILKKFFENIPRASLNEIHIGHIELYRRNYLNQKSINSQRNALQVLKSFFRELFEDKYIDKNPFRRIKLPKRDQLAFKKTVPTKKDIEILKTTTTHDRDRLLIDFLYKTGLRISSALSIKIEDFKLNERGKYEAEYVGKGKKIGTVSINTELYNDLLNLAGKKGVLFKNLKINKDQSITSTYAAKLFKRLSIKAKIYPEIHPHALRHAHGTHAKQNGASLEQIRKGLNHAALDTTLIYSESAIEETSSDFIS